jgi:D-threo-aldose 1-dehydrogenase
VEWFRTPIPADLWAELKHDGLLREDAPVPTASASASGVIA